MTTNVVTASQVYRMINGKGFDPTEVNAGTRGVYGVSGATSNFQNALKQASKRRVIVNVVGDSITEGNFASDMRSLPSGTGYISLIKNKMQQLYGDGGSGYQQFYNPSLNGTAYNGLGTIPFTLTGVTTTDWTFPASTSGRIGIPPGSYLSLLTSTASITSYARGSSIVLFMMYSVNGAKLDITIDGIFKETIDTNRTTGNTNDFLTQVYTGYDPNVTHTVTIAYNASSTATYTGNLMGIGGYNPTGVVFNKFTIPGLQSIQLTAASEASESTFGGDNFPYLWNTISGTLMTSNQSGLYPANIRNSSQVPYFACDLFMYVLNINNSDYTAYPMYDKWFNGFNAMKQANPTIDLMCVQPVSGAFVNGTLTTGDSRYNGFTYAEYRKSIRELMELFGGLYIDLNLLIPNAQSFAMTSQMGFWSVGASNYSSTGATGQAGQSGFATTSNANSVHPSDIGHRMMADALVPFFLTKF